MTFPASGRAGSTLIEGAQPRLFPHLEFHLRRLKRFFAEECVLTVFPECRAFMERCAARAAAASQPANIAVCVLFTFQESQGDLVPATENELAEERGAFLSAVRPVGTDSGARSPDPSGAGDAHNGTLGVQSTTVTDSLIGYRPESYIWKDRSREVFFSFARTAEKTLRAALERQPASPVGSAAAAGGGAEHEPLPAQGSSLDSSEPLLFFDWCDPATGLPMNTPRGPTSFVDADAIERMFPFDSVLIAGAGGGCRMVSHPRFGLGVYPAAAILACPEDQLDVVCQALRSMTV